MEIELLKIACQRWSIALLIGFVLIGFRKDSYRVISDIERMLMRYPVFSIFTIIFLFVIVPFTIPFSLHNIFFTRNDNTPNNRKPDE
jgi:hypothetical protein